MLTPIEKPALMTQPFDRTPPNEKCPQSAAEPQDLNTTINTDVIIYPPIPKTFTANYASFSTAFLSPTFIQNHWDDSPIVIDGTNSQTGFEGQFLDAAGRVSVNTDFTSRIITGSVIDFGLDDDLFKFFASYSQLMDDKYAYIRIVAYDRFGGRCSSFHRAFGNFILVIPRRLNDVVFPPQLRFHALHVTEYCHNPDEVHLRIRRAAEGAMTALERAWWDSARCAICDSDL